MGRAAPLRDVFAPSPSMSVFALTIAESIARLWWRRRSTPYRSRTPRAPSSSVVSRSPADSTTTSAQCHAAASPVVLPHRRSDNTRRAHEQQVRRRIRHDPHSALRGPTLGPSRRCCASST
jgi:hypothetical protein